MASYSQLQKQVFTEGNYSIVPIRMKDRYDIMEWRNEQMFHLRQNEALTRDQQDIYFESVVSKLYEKKKPEQILFSYLEGGKCIGYGGLVHINWHDKHAEISFIIKTELEKKYFQSHWVNFLRLIEEVAFMELKFHKIYTYAYDLRPNLYKALLSARFHEEAKLKEHCFFNEKYIDVLIHSKFNKHC